MPKINKLIVLLAIVVFTLLGCTSTDLNDSKKVLANYLDSIISKDFGTAYNLLSSSDHKTISSSDFVIWQSLYQETEQLKSYSIGNGKPLTNYTDALGNKYATAIEYPITRTDYVHDSGKDNTYDYTLVVVTENKQWKVNRGEQSEFYVQRIYSAYKIIGSMYAEGKVKDQDLNKALEHYQKALDYISTDNPLAFETVLLALKLEKPEIAEKYCQKALKNSLEPTEASEFYNVLGVSLLMQKKNADAQKAFEEALRLDPTNSNAQTNLNNALKN